MLRTIILTIALAFITSGCAARAQGSIQIQSGFFFGLNLQQSQSVTYVLDLSGSMSGQSGSIVEQAGTSATSKVGGVLSRGIFGKKAGNSVEKRIADSQKKIALVKNHLIASIQGLPPGSQFNVILFSNGVQKLAPGMIVANVGTKLLVSAFVDKLSEGGGTNMYSALEAGFFSGGQHIILLTDGLPTSSSPEDIMNLARQNNSDKRFMVSTVGVGTDQAFTFLQQLAQENRGQYQAYN